MTALRWFTAGESHGPGILAVVEGVPAGVLVDLASIDGELRRRMGGHGRGKRMEIEKDRVQVLGGLKRGVTLGSPVALLVANKDVRIDAYRRISRPRPGHADLAGSYKYGTRDCSDVMERASARETAARVAAGALASQVLATLGIEVFSWVCAIGEARLDGSPARREGRRAIRDASPVYSLDPDGDARAVGLIDRMRDGQDSIGGAFVVEARGVPAGLGSPMQWDLRLDGRLARAVMAIPAIKAVEIGSGVEAGRLSGQEFHDPILPGAKGPSRPTNHAGGIEGGMTNGEPVLVRATMKPIPSVRKPLPSIDLDTGEAAPAVYERSDVCAVPAASVVGEAVVCLQLLEAVLEKTGGDTITEVARNLKSYAGQGFERGGSCP